MNLIDLPECQQGTLCNICGEDEGRTLADLHDRDLGPLCHECFCHSLRATVLLRWVTATDRPTEN